ncbi:restriction endonuclease [Streptomyces sp. NPDC097941]|uniref:restriction endonuclease n=1 Tax=Streptomyces sp. NPDC097941 TaxID=3155685 RepID=UPI00333319E7
MGFSRAPHPSLSSPAEPSSTSPCSSATAKSHVRCVCTSWTWSTWPAPSLWTTPSPGRPSPSTTASTNASPTSSARPSYRCSTPCFEQLRRDGCTNVVVQGGRGDRGVDIIGLTAAGRRLVVQCKRFAPYLNITSPEVQKFVGAAKVLHNADVALYVATCPFTPEALSIAAETGITVVHRGLLEQWSAGEPLAARESCGFGPPSC